jgi:hypothetical protein
VTASGWDTMDACEAATSSIRALARSAMNRCPAGGMARSSVPSRYHDGMDRHPGGPEGVAAAAPLQGRWVATITLAVGRARSLRPAHRMSVDGLPGCRGGSPAAVLT